MSNTQNLRSWKSHKVELLIPNFKNDGDRTLALVKAVGKIKLTDPPRAIPRGKAFIVPVHELMEVPK